MQRKAVGYEGRRMNQTRFSRRMGEHFPYGNEYGCAITAYERKAGQAAVYIACAIGFVAVVAVLIFN